MSGKGRNTGANVRFTEIERETHRNAALSMGKSGEFSEENGVNFAERGVLPRGQF